MKHYLIGDVAKLLPISKDTLRYYDKLGIVSPRKSPHNNYRYYTKEDLLALSYVLVLRDLELPLEEIKERICNNSLEDFKILLARQEKLIEERLIKLTKLKEKVHYFKEDIFKAQAYFKKIDCIMSPHFIYKTLSSEFDPSYTDILTEMTNEPCILAPVFSALLCSENFFSQSQFDLLAISGLASSQYDLALKDSYKHFEPTLCLHTVLIIGDTILDEDLNRIKDYLTQHKLHLNGDILARCIAFEHVDEVPIEYYELFIPIKN